MGANYNRSMALQKAVTFVLDAVEGVKPFPGKIVVMENRNFDSLVTEIVTKANRGNWDPPITKGEAARDLQYRGYRRGKHTTAPVDFTEYPPPD